MLWSMLTKNQMVDIKITDQGKTGDGVGLVDEMPIYTPNCIPGDRVQVKIVKVEKRRAYGKLISVLTPSPDWVEPVCLVAATCGGCQLQHQSHDAQLAFKQKFPKRDRYRFYSAYANCSGWSKAKLKTMSLFINKQFFKKT